MNENEEILNENELENEELDLEEENDESEEIHFTDEQVKEILDDTHKEDIDIDLMINKCLWQYWAYVNYQRAIPDLTDWLKPAQRRIIFAMKELWMTPTWKHLKSARLEWEVIWKYHPHWWCYSTFSWMAQDFSYRYPLIDWQGNFWSISWDAPAAQRYTEVRPSKLFNLLVDNIDKLDDSMFHDNYDGTLKEPNVLPAKIPFIFLNGTTWIWLGISSQTMPFNLWEVVDTLIWRIQDKNFDISKTLKWPDFCMKGTVLTTEEQWKKILETWKWSVTFVSDVEINRSERKTWNSELIIKSLWPNIWVDKIIDKLRELVESKKITEIVDVRDESTSNTDLDLKIILRQKTNEEVILNKLMKMTQLQTSVNTRMIVLNDWKHPHLRSFYEIFDNFIEWRKWIVKQILNYDLKQAKWYKKIIEAKISAINNIDTVIEIIKNETDETVILSKLKEVLKVDDEQVEVIYNLKLKQLKSIDLDELKTNLETTNTEIDKITKILENEQELINYMIDEWTKIKEKYWDKRRTVIEYWKSWIQDIDEDQFYDDKDIKIYLTKEWYLKKSEDVKFSTQNRWWKWKSWDIKTITDDVLIKTLVTTNKKLIWLITESWRLYYLKWYKFPTNSKWLPLSSILWKELNENVVNMFVVDELKNKKVLIIFEKWYWLITDWSVLSDRRQWSLVFKWKIVKFIDSVDWREDDYLIIWKKYWFCNKFKVSEIKEISKVWKWIKLTKLNEWETVISADYFKEWDSILIISNKWYWKISKTDEIRETKRWWKWVMIWIKDWDSLCYIWKINFENLDNTIIMMTTTQNKIISIKWSSISRETSRKSKWIKLLNLWDENDSILNVEVFEN